MFISRPVLVPASSIPRNGAKDDDNRQGDDDPSESEKFPSDGLQVGDAAEEFEASDAADRKLAEAARERRVARALEPAAVRPLAAFTVVATRRTHLSQAMVI